jgi:hypothetical protein
VSILSFAFPDCLVWADDMNWLLTVQWCARIIHLEQLSSWDILWPSSRARGLARCSVFQPRWGPCWTALF